MNSCLQKSHPLHTHSTPSPHPLSLTSRKKSLCWLAVASDTSRHPLFQIRDTVLTSPSKNQSVQSLPNPTQQEHTTRRFLPGAGQSSSRPSQRSVTLVSTRTWSLSRRIAGDPVLSPPSGAPRGGEGERPRNVACFIAFQHSSVS